ncbi:MAG: acyl-CoA dehydrogenase family protein [Verrucomicrobiota bacterium]|jgi:alkylation response protein AidB-like acyl-CoA dehydrogenase
MVSSVSDHKCAGSIPAQYGDAVRLEQLLGDPGNPENLLSFCQAMAWDEQEQFPQAAISRLHQLGLHHFYVPKSLGGRFELCESFIALGRTLARRNMSVVVSHSTMLWTMLAWMGADSDQQRGVARAVLRNGEFPCLAYSEESHGADLLANETTAQADEHGRYWVRGEKWPVNRATRSQWVVLLARTDAASHFRNHSLFIFDKARLDAREYHHLPGTRTHGLRGCDISGIRFQDCRLPQDARIGREGEGIELALKGFQITRTFCTALSLGVGDSALRMVVDFTFQLSAGLLAQAQDVALDSLPALHSFQFHRITSADPTGKNDDWRRLQPGHTLVLAEITGPGCITHFRDNITGEEPHHLQYHSSRKIIELLNKGLAGELKAVIPHEI